MNQIHISLTKEQNDRLRQEKEKTGLTIGSQIRLALTEYWRSKNDF